MKDTSCIYSGGATVAGRKSVFGSINALPLKIQTKYPQCVNDYNDVDDPSTGHLGKTHWQVAQCLWPTFTTDREFFANIFGKRIGGLSGDATEQPQLNDFSTWVGNKFWDETRDYMDSIDWTGYTP